MSSSLTIETWRKWFCQANWSGPRPGLSCFQTICVFDLLIRYVFRPSPSEAFTASSVQSATTVAYALYNHNKKNKIKLFSANSQSQHGQHCQTCIVDCTFCCKTFLLPLVLRGESTAIDSWKTFSVLQNQVQNKKNTYLDMHGLIIETSMWHLDYLRYDNWSWLDLGNPIGKAVYQLGMCWLIF
jgi:hypothetical protein